MADKVENAMAIIGAELKEKLGKRCDDFDPTCLTCFAWRAFTDLSRVLYEIEKK